MMIVMMTSKHCGDLEDVKGGSPFEPTLTRHQNFSMTKKNAQGNAVFNSDKDRLGAI